MKRRRLTTETVSSVASQPQTNNISVASVNHSIQPLTNSVQASPQPVVEYHSVFAEHQCVICFEVLLQAVRIVECSHTFCAYCLRQWLLTNPACPVCRQRVRRNPIFDEESNAFIECELTKHPNSYPQLRQTRARLKEERGVAVFSLNVFNQAFPPAAGQVDLDTSSDMSTFLLDQNILLPFTGEFDLSMASPGSSLYYSSATSSSSSTTSSSFTPSSTSTPALSSTPTSPSTPSPLSTSSSSTSNIAPSSPESDDADDTEANFSSLDSDDLIFTYSPRALLFNTSSSSSSSSYRSRSPYRTNPTHHSTFTDSSDDSSAAVRRRSSCGNRRPNQSIRGRLTSRGRGRGAYAASRASSRGRGRRGCGRGRANYSRRHHRTP